MYFDLFTGRWNLWGYGSWLQIVGAAAKLVPEGLEWGCRGGCDWEMVPISYSVGEESSLIWQALKSLCTTSSPNLQEEVLEFIKARRTEGMGVSPLKDAGKLVADPKEQARLQNQFRSMFSPKRLHNTWRVWTALPPHPPPFRPFVHFVVVVPMGISGCFPQGKPAATVLHYPTLIHYKVHAGSFRSPPNSDADYRISNMHTWSVLCVHIHTEIGHTDSLYN